MDLVKQIIHLYDGSMDGGAPCSKCGKGAFTILHIQNGGVVCDAVNWPCACGAWHDDIEMDQKLRMVNTNYNEWLRKVSAPGYVLTKDDKDVLEALES